MAGRCGDALPAYAFSCACRWCQTYAEHLGTPPKFIVKIENVCPGEWHVLMYWKNAGEKSNNLAKL